MRLGKLDNHMLERVVLSKFTKVRPETLTMPQIGEDCALADFQGDYLVLSTDPITSADAHLGRLSVHINCNDAAAAGADPVGLMVTLLAPPTATIEEIEAIVDELAEAALEAGVDVMGGHTEVTDAVTRFVTNTTVVARLPKTGRLPGMRPGDALLMTKWAGLEGSAVIASDYQNRIAGLGEQALDTLKGLTRYLSVLPEGRFAAKNGATAMHDITEGGVYGAAWEMAHTAGCGLCLEEGAIPIMPETEAMCEMLGLDPMRLLSSGSMLIACPDGVAMAKGLSGIGIPAVEIGRATEQPGVILTDGTPIHPPEADELYRLF